jgi:diacylglycerol kinase (ATP)
LKNMKIAAVVNPASANGVTARRWPEISALMKEAGLSFEALMTTAPEHATELTRRALRGGCDLVVSVGGDGTHNEVVNGFFTPEGPLRTEAQLSFISMGTGSDLIKTLRVPKDPELALKHLLKGSPRGVDLGRLSLSTIAGIRRSAILSISPGWASMATPWTGSTGPARPWAASSHFSGAPWLA